MGWFAAYMTHLKSIWIYQKVTQIGFVQFPWRFLALVIFAFSFVAGALPEVLSKLNDNSSIKTQKGSFVSFHWLRMTMAICLSILIVIVNWKYFLPEYGKMGPITDEQKFSGKAWEYQQTSAIYDYLPKTADTAPKSQKTVGVELMDGEAAVINYKEGTYWAKFEIDAEEKSQVRINILNFPGWHVFVDGIETAIFIPEEEDWGRIWIKVNEGKHMVYAAFSNTPIRTVANLISFVSWIILFAFGARIYKEKKLR
jgi:hypothetical protein